MSDHLFEPAVFERLDERFDPDDDTDMGAMLAVDAKLGTIFDMDDANKIRCVDGRFEDIGKQLTAFNLVDAGLFWCGRAFVEALRREKADRHDCSTSDAVRRLAAAGRCCFWDIGPGRWQDVDTPQARAHARQLMASWSAAQVSL